MLNVKISKMRYKKEKRVTINIKSIAVDGNSSLMKFLSIKPFSPFINSCLHRISLKFKSPF